MKTSHVIKAQSSAAFAVHKGLAFVRLTGADRVDLLNRLTTNELINIKPFAGKQTVALTDKARIIDVCSVLHEEQQTFLLGSVNTAPELVRWLKTYIIMDDVKVADISANVETIEVFGPRSADVIMELTGVDVFSLGVSNHVLSDGIRIVRTPSSAELGYTILGDPEIIQMLLSTLQASEDTVPEVSAQEYEYLRIHAGMGKIGHEWSLDYNPLEAGLLHLTSFTKGCYIGQEVVARLDSYNKVKQRVMGLSSDSEIILNSELFADGVKVGAITSVAQAKNNVWLALGYIRGEHAHPGSTLTASNNNSSNKVTIHLLPFGSDV